MRKEVFDKLYDIAERGMKQKADLEVVEGLDGRVSEGFLK